MKKAGCKTNHLPFVDDLKLFAKNEVEIDSLVQDNIGSLIWRNDAPITMQRGISLHSDDIVLP